MKHYKLDKDFNHIPCSLEEWCVFFEDIENRRVASTNIDETTGTVVSTVFLGFDHGFGESEEPVLYETMVFSNIEALSDQMQRYTTHKLALSGHEQMVEYVKRYFAKQRYFDEHVFPKKE
jgi:hypothetical protein